LEIRGAGVLPVVEGQVSGQLQPYLGRDDTAACATSVHQKDFLSLPALDDLACDRNMSLRIKSHANPPEFTLSLATFPADALREHEGRPSNSTALPSTGR
jgi:hypothetical protein